ALRLVEAGDAVEERGLAGAVGTDEARDDAFIDGEIHPVQHRVSGKSERQVRELQQRGHQRCPPAGQMPLGLNSMISKSPTAKTSSRMSPRSRSSSGPRTTMKAPSTTPGILPMPPRMTAIRISTDCSKEKLSGEIAPRLTAKKAPPTAPKMAPMT